MLGSRWVRKALLLLLLAAAAAAASGPSKRDSENIERWLEVPVRTPGDAILTIAPAESQQISVVVAPDLQASETGYGKGHGKGSSHKGHKGYKGGYHDAEGYKGKKGYKADKGYKKSHYGDYGKDHKEGYHDKGGKHYKGHNDKHKYYGDEHKGKKGKKGHHYGSKGYHNKGHKDKGFKNVYHKEEYHHHKKYYDDFDNKKYHNKYDDFDSYFKAHKGKDYKGGHYKREITQKAYHTATRSEPQLQVSSIILRLNAVLENINDTYSISRADVDTETKRYFGRVLLDMSRHGSRYEERDEYDDQCQTSDLKLIKRYMNNCSKFMRKYGMRKDRTPPCINEDVVKIKKYLDICQRSFTKRASSRTRKKYSKLMDLAHKLDLMTYPEEGNEENDENHYVTEDVCKADDLRQMEIYLKDCASGEEEDEDSGRPACDLPNYEKSLDYLSACESTFLSRASHGDRNEYNHLISINLNLIKRERVQTEKAKYGESDDSQSDCTLEDLRESQNYIEECESLLYTESYQREYGSQMCRPKYMKKVHKFLLSCKHLVRNAPSKDIKKFNELLDTSARLSGKPGKPKKVELVEDKIDEYPDCILEDLRSIPKYLRACYKSRKCESDQLLEIHEFLVMCEDSFIKYASPRDKKKYKDLVLMSDMLSTNEILQKQVRDHDDKEHMESICKIQILRKVPKYLKGCFESGNCNSKQLLKVIKFLSLCEDFFSIAFSPKDRGKYKELKEMAEELYAQAEEKTKSKIKDKSDHRGPDCSLRDLRKIPNYLKGCEKNRNCRRRQLSKVYQFLYYCEIPLTRRASQRDKRKYKKIMLKSKSLSERRQQKQQKCEISQLKKLPKFLQKCHKFRNCRQRQLLKAQKYLRQCKTTFFRRASKGDKRKYKVLSVLAATLTSHRHRRGTRKGVHKKRKDTQSQCHVKDLRKIPRYLKRCERKHGCKHKQLIKVKRFLVSCKDSFTRRASRKDKIKYQRLSLKATALTKSTPKRRSYKKMKKESQTYCKITDLRKIPSYLKGCAKSHKCKHRQIKKVRSFLSSCQTQFTRRASKRDKRVYQKFSSMAAALARQRKGRTSRRGVHKKKKVTQSQCHVRDLRKIPSYLKRCERKHNCEHKQVIKIKRFLVSCKAAFARKASRTDKIKFQKLSLKVNSLTKRSQKRSHKMRKQRRSYCKIRDLRKIPQYLKGCAKTHQCKHKQIQKVSRFLSFCQTQFTRRASRRDKRVYQKLSSMAAALARQRQGRASRRGVHKKRKVAQSQCPVKDLRKIPSYLKRCERKRNCEYKHLMKIKRFLVLCRNAFARKASRTDQMKYQKLSLEVNSLTKMSQKRSHKKIGKDRQSYCKIRDLRKIPQYLRGCAKTHQCKHKQIRKVSRFLSSCQAQFTRRASRRDKREYQKLSSIAAALARKRQGRASTRGVHKKRKVAQSQCHVRDLRKIPSYLKRCERKRNCDYKQLVKIRRFLVLCKNAFARKASRTDKIKYQKMSLKVNALTKRSQKIRSHKKIRKDRQSYCKIRDLRKIPQYLKGCAKTHQCKHKQIRKVSRFLSSCQTQFTRRASRRDKRIYQKLYSMTKTLTRHRHRKASRKSVHKKKKDIKSQCHVRDLRKIPNYLKRCERSHNCEHKQLVRVKRFLVSCKDIFSKRASRKDKIKYKKLSLKATGLTKKRQKRVGHKTKKDRQSYCTIRDLRKIPGYLKGCGNTHRCKHGQIMKVRKFLSSCQTQFTRKASRKDRRVYQKLSSMAEALSKHRFRKSGREMKRDTKQYYCKLADLRRVPSYLKHCSKSRKCNRGQLVRVKSFLNSCKKTFTRKTSRKDRRIYQRITLMAEALTKHLPRGAIDKGKYTEKQRRFKRSQCQVRDLRKVPSYLKSCTKKHDCQQKQVVKVEKFLTLCESHFLRRANRKDAEKYKQLIRNSKKLVSRGTSKKIERRRRRRRVKPERHDMCQVKNLRLIHKHLTTCNQGARQNRSLRGICSSTQIANMQNYLLDCQKIFLRKATRRDKTKYKGLLILSQKLKKARVTRGRKRDVRRRDTKQPVCQVLDLRKIPKYLKDCTTGVILRGRKKITCGRRHLGRIQTYLSSCKSAFFKKASSGDRIHYRRLEVEAAKILSRKVKGKHFRRARKPVPSKIARCKSEELRKIRDYLKNCSVAVKKGRLRNEKRCNTRVISRVQKYLKSCQNSFLKKASRGDKRQYRYLSVLATRLSKQVSMSRAKRPLKKAQTYSCKKQDLRELEKHYRFCKAKLRTGARGKSQLKRRRGSSRVQKRHRQEKLKRIRSRRQHRRDRRLPRKRSRRMGRKENGRRGSRSWRARLKYRKGGKHHDKYGKKGHHEKGKYHDDHKGHKGHYAHKGHYGHKSAYGDKGGYKGSYGHDDHKGYGHDDHHGGYGHDHHGYGRRYFDPHLKEYCFTKRICVPYAPHLYPVPFLVF